MSKARRDVLDFVLGLVVDDGDLVGLVARLDVASRRQAQRRQLVSRLSVHERTDEADVVAAVVVQ